MHLEPERHRSPTISLTPLIDVVFILLVFFMLASRFSQWKDLPVDVRVPDAPLQSDHEKRLILTVVADGRVRWGSDTLSLDQLRPRLAGVDRPVIVTGDADTPLQAALAALDVVRAAGVEKVQLELMP